MKVVEKRYQYAIAGVTTGHVFPKTFDSEQEAVDYKKKRPEPDHWKIVKREVTYTNWE